MVVSTSAQLFVKPLGYVHETTEGTVPTSSPYFSPVGAVTALNYKKDNSLIEIGQIGSEDVIDYVTGLTVREASVSFGLISSTFLKRAVNAANFATPTGTISQTFSLVYSIYLDAIENFVFLKGCRPKSCSINMEIGKVTECSMDMVCTSITKPATSSGLTTPTFASLASGDVWDWLDGGADPVSVNSVAQSCIKFSCNIERNTSMDFTLGNSAGFGSQPHARRIRGEFTTLWTADTEETLFDASTEHTIAVVLKSATSTLTLTGCEISMISRDHSADEGGATVTTYAYTAEAASLT